MTDLSFGRNKVLWYVDVAKCPPARCGEPNCMFSIAVIINIFAIFANDLLCHTVPLLWFAKKVAKYIKRVPLLLLFDLSQKLLTTKKTMTTSSTVADSWKTPLAIHFSQFVPTVLCAQRFLLNFASLFVLELCISFPLQKLSHVGFFQELVAMTTKTSSRTLSECRALLAWCEETTAKTSK